ncbi:DUF21 domain-containing protein [Capsicum baccatum]|uniref:Ribulose bisphosphate carboxylase large chain n=1 Tax=Capsicum baccatum TaxID=33114 RepID=A0A2G2WWN0_CAPBA|nr:DUF21 domain-containing protein [Capsicum baccatum]
MHPLNAVAVVRMATKCHSGLGAEIAFGTVSWFVYAGISCLLVLFAGIMSGLTLGLMSLGLVELEILQQSGTPSEKNQAATILPVVQKQHQLLVTLLLCNAAAMEALPLYLDKLFNQYLAIILSVTFVLFFGEVIPQAICTRYGLAVGSNFVWLVRILMFLCYPIAYPIGKAGKGGELTHDETTIISGALDLTEKQRSFEQEQKDVQASRILCVASFVGIPDLCLKLPALLLIPFPWHLPEEAGAAVAAESSTGTWTTVWTDGLTSLDRVTDTQGTNLIPPRHDAFPGHDQGDNVISPHRATEQFPNCENPVKVCDHGHRVCFIRDEAGRVADNAQSTTLVRV